jgi:germination protein M
MIDGESLQDMNGQVVGYMQPSDFVKNTGVSLHSYQKETFLLYYGNKQGDRLVKEKVSIRYNSSISKEKVLVEQLTEYFDRPAMHNHCTSCDCKSKPCPADFPGM